MDGVTKKKEIVKKGVELFKAYGYDNVTVQQIAKACDISKNTFYYYFDNKEDIIRTAFFRRQESDAELFSKILLESDPYQQLIGLLEPMINYVESLGREVVKKALILNLGNDLMKEHPEEEDRQFHRQHKMILDSIMKRGQEEGKIRSDISCKELARTSGAVMIGCIQIWATADHDFSLKEMTLNHLAVVLRKSE